MEEKLDLILSELKETNKRLSNVEARLDKVETKIDNLEEKIDKCFDGTGKDFTQVLAIAATIDKKIDRHAARVEKISATNKEMEYRIEDLEAKLSCYNHSVRDNLE